MWPLSNNHCKATERKDKQKRSLDKRGDTTSSQSTDVTAYFSPMTSLNPHGLRRWEGFIQSLAVFLSFVQKCLWHGLLCDPPKLNNRRQIKYKQITVFYMEYGDSIFELDTRHIKYNKRFLFCAVYNKCTFLSVCFSLFWKHIIWNDELGNVRTPGSRILREKQTLSERTKPQHLANHRHLSHSHPRNDDTRSKLESKLKI